MAAKEVAILGVGMHPWRKWGRNFCHPFSMHAAIRLQLMVVILIARS